MACLLAVAGECGGAARGAEWGAPQAVPVTQSLAPGTFAYVDPAGRGYALWTARRPEGFAIVMSQRNPGGGWSPPEGVTTPGPFDVATVGIAANQRGDLAVVWGMSGDGRSVVMARVRRPGGGWSAERAVSRVGAPGVAVPVIDERGAVTVVGAGLRGTGLWATRHEPGGDWTRLTRIVDAPVAPTMVPLARVNASGQVSVAVAVAPRGGRHRIAFAISDRHGRFGPAETLPGIAAATPVSLATSDGGVSVLVSRPGTGSVIRSVPLRLSVRRAGRPWTAPRALAPAAARVDRGTAAAPSGPAVAVAWAQWDGPAARRRASVRALTVDAAGRVGAARVLGRLSVPAEQLPGAARPSGPPMLPPAPWVVAGDPATVAWSEAPPTAGGTGILRMRRMDGTSPPPLRARSLSTFRAMGPGLAIWGSAADGGFPTGIRSAELR